MARIILATLFLGPVGLIFISVWYALNTTLMTIFIIWLAPSQIEYEVAIFLWLFWIGVGIFETWNMERGQSNG